ncbi:fimbrial protein [Salmonella enterica subsp. enterica]|uniref:Fimbrial protein n=1 Tax=Salmonella enterica subsp. enterica serovar Macclesfield str. S-1643 TaxID=1242107 RepID=A0A2C9P3N7_SALET|nr:fimbrial-like protein [Salmonella enterica]EAA5485124.1 fimbrial protein [Salmonella enterica subsp. enterica serovar Kouka]EBS1106094.1 fimbrial protein [Salmonella enterica subsp. enterica serovar Eingedi]EBV2192186.1 fimbrial protein [Salmonella enterica subsp. enterica serovar Afula]ECH9426286.1 fimbrial protein [Salmonella enterica subsp. enterica]ASG18019.1 fimbrial protein [Salmonella enterica subsp. enterica serovar Macclesfield str. S-1643]
MQQSPFTLHQPGLMLLIGLAGSALPGVSQADLGVDVNLTANIVNNTCQLSVENGGEIYLPTVARDWFYNSDKSDRLSPTDDEAGTPFTIHVDNCYASSAQSATINQLTFSFSPQNGFWSSNKQVFKNDATAGAAENVGIVIFSEQFKTNVLNSDGTSKVIYEVSGSSDSYIKDYGFYARYQNVGAITSGSVMSNVLVNVSYE